MNAREHGLVQCPVCPTLCRRPATGERHGCPRCGARLEDRRPAGLARPLALLLTACLLYLPANLLPIMQTGSFMGTQHDTILSGVLYLWASGSWPLAILVFVASVLVPLLKLLALSWLIWSVRPGASGGRRHQRARLYHLIEFIGPWSMLDVYVVALLVALVHFGGLASVSPGPAALAFGAVVVLTMLAAQSFDPRLIWQTPVPQERAAP